MSPSIIPDRVIPPEQFAPEEARSAVVTLIPRMTFNPPANSIQSINDQVAEHHSLATMANRYIPESIGALKGDHKIIIMKLDQLLQGIVDIKLRLDRLEAAE